MGKLLQQKGLEIASLAPIFQDRSIITGYRSILKFTHPFAQQTGPKIAHLRVMATTDVHAHIFAYDYYSDQISPTVGLARTGCLVKDLRKNCDNSLLLDNGDFLQGNPLGDYVASERKRAKIHPVIAAMNLMHYDAATLGNHEFNYGLDFLRRSLSQAHFPFVCANLRLIGQTANDTPMHQPFVLLNQTLTDGEGQEISIRIGITGFLPPQVLKWDKALLSSVVEIEDIVTSAKQIVPRMKAEGADIVILLAHSGMGGEATPGAENASAALTKLADVDAVVAGHIHLVFPSHDFDAHPEYDLTEGKINGVPVVMPGFWGSHLGVIDLLLENSAKGWRVLKSGTSTLPIAKRNANGSIKPIVKDCPDISAVAAQDHQSTLTFMRREVGWTERPLHTFFGRVCDSPALQIICRAQAWHIAGAIDKTAFSSLPILSAAAPFKSGGRAGPEHFTIVERGGMVLRNVADLYPYPNTICAVRVNKAQLINWLEHSASSFNQIRPEGRDVPLLDAEFPGYLFDVIYGLTYDIDVSVPPRFDAEGTLINPNACRIQNLRYAGKYVEDDMEFIVATNSYRLSCLEFGAEYGYKELVYSAPTNNDDILLRYIESNNPLCSLPQNNWALALPKKASVVFETSPKALPHLPDITSLSVTPIGTNPGGFLRLRLERRD